MPTRHLGCLSSYACSVEHGAAAAALTSPAGGRPRSSSDEEDRKLYPDMHNKKGTLKLDKNRFHDDAY